MRGGAPPDLLYAELNCPAVAANTVTAFLGLVPNPGADRRLRAWIIGAYGNAADSAAPMATEWFADFIFNGPAQRFGRVSGDSFAFRHITFPGGFTYTAQRPIDVRFQASIANPPLTAFIYYIIEDM